MLANHRATVPQILGISTFLQCRGCQTELKVELAEQRVKVDEANPVVCEVCNGIYCIECDIFVHQTLLQCPTCN
jgi:transcription factor Ssl1